MAESDGQEKTEQATSKRLDESREKGQVAKSTEINSLAIFLSGLMIIYFYKTDIGEKISWLATYIFSSLDKLELNVNLLQVYSAKGFVYFLSIMAPFFIVLMVVSLAAGFAQVGFHFAFKALAPKASKFNPVSGLKRVMFSSHSVVEVTKSIIKLVIISLFAYWILSDTIVQSVGLVDFSVEEIVSFMIDTTVKFLWKVALVYIAIAASDFAYQKFKHKKDLMMTKQEVKEEFKQQEGDPAVKGKIKQKQMIMAHRRMMKEVPKADVVITNPTHFAVALKYEMGKDSAPKVVAKGADLIAQKIKEIAKENDVPLHEDVYLARSLYKMCEIGDEVPEELFQAVAQILAYIYQLKNTYKKTIV
ncbi:MAG: flagellar biosynthesis protein FlhB [Ignavibacteria bacterium]|nr:flagellar biosynthesis protein FlhB [Ignavibacteria bacterium]